MSRPSDAILPCKPAHDVDFPVERVEGEHVSRREFAKFLCLVSGGMAVGSGWVAVKDHVLPPIHFTGQARICAEADLAIGETRGFVLPGSARPYILIRLAQGEWSAFEQKCTHLSCAVYYQPSRGLIECPCHHGAFNARTGEVLEGPPPRPLHKLTVTVSDHAVFVSEPAATQAIPG